MTGVLAVGVAVLDLIFQVDEMPRAAEKYRARDAAVTGGGCAANAAVAVSRLGGRAALASRVGDDAIGDLVVAGLKAESVDCHSVRRFSGKRSQFTSVYIDRAGERQIVSYRDWSIPTDAGWILHLLTDGVGAVLADTRWSEGAVAAMQLARERGLAGILDGEAPFQEASDAVSLASHVAFSARGLREYAGEDDLESALRGVAERTGNIVCVTDGERGVWWRAGTRSGHVPAFPVRAVETLGAGDIWHGAFALEIAQGAELVPAIRFASAYAALKCTRFGGRGTYPDRSETEAFMAHAAG